MRIIIILLFFALQVGNSQSQNLNKTKLNTDSLSLYLFLLDDCPICLNYTVLLNDLYTEYGSRINFQGYFPNFSSKPKKIEFFKETYHIEFPVQTDYYKEQAKKWNAQVTPEVILYNNTTKKIIYQGRIDNKFVRIGKRRNVVTEHNLVNAIELTLESKEVLPSFAEPVGCFINYSDNISRNK
jgi:thioredoxin-related protein